MCEPCAGARPGRSSGLGPSPLSLVRPNSQIAFIDRPTDDPTVRQPDITLASSQLGWQPHIDLDTGLARTIDWFRSHPELVA